MKWETSVLIALKPSPWLEWRNKEGGERIIHMGDNGPLATVT